MGDSVEGLDFAKNRVAAARVLAVQASECRGASAADG
jgi:hypothetical protein